eukprot:449923-Pleurochrysis_carterae.AAC.1
MARSSGAKLRRGWREHEKDRARSCTAIVREVLLWYTQLSPQFSLLCFSETSKQSFKEFNKSQRFHSCETRPQNNLAEKSLGENSKRLGAKM